MVGQIFYYVGQLALGLVSFGLGVGVTKAIDRDESSWFGLLAGAATAGVGVTLSTLMMNTIAIDEFGTLFPKQIMP